MRPYISCHMLSSIDGKIDGGALRAVTGKRDYESTGARLKGEAWVCGRTTMQQHFAQKQPFVSKTKLILSSDSPIFPSCPAFP